MKPSAFPSVARARCLRPLAASVALALGTASAGASELLSLHDAHDGSQYHAATRSAGRAPTAAVGVTHIVTTCDDTLVTPICNGVDDGTLRKAYFCAHDNDTIDLTQLACSRISLATVLTDGAPASVALQGPGKDLLTIDGGGRTRVLVHNGSGNLTINDVTITNGRFDNPYGYGGGGCIYSFGDLTLSSSTVSTCLTTSTGDHAARGGAIFAKNDVTVISSSVTGSSAYSADGPSAGGGIWAHSMILAQSSIDRNTASSYGSYATGGGLYAINKISTAYSTISRNAASQGGATFSAAATLVNSTVSGNDAFAVGGVYARIAANVYNSTIARNASAISAAGLYAGAGFIQLVSSIVANNMTDAAGFDVGAGHATTISGANNLIMVRAADIDVAAETISGDPKLGPLQDNGGTTLTHALIAVSPAIDKGNNIPGYQGDQRGFARVVGSSADIGAFELVDKIFANGFNLVEVVH